MYVSHYNRNYLEKYIVNKKNSHEQNVLTIRFYICYANFITIGEPPIVFYIYMKTLIVIISKISRKSKNSHKQNVLRIQFYICCTNFIRIGEQIRDVA